MTLRFKHAFHAAIGAAILSATFSMFFVGINSPSPSDALIATVASALVAYVVTLPLWWTAFAADQNRPQRILWIGPLLLAANISLQLPTISFALPAAHNMSFFETAMLGVFVSLLFAPAILPAGIMLTFITRKIQIGTKRRDVIRFTTKTIGIIFGVFIALFTIGFGALLYAVNDFSESGAVYTTSRSPSGKLTLTIRENCLSHACDHQASLKSNKGWFDGWFNSSSPCNLGIRSDGIEFGPGSILKWNAAETVVMWTGANEGMSGQLDLRKSCKSFPL